MPYPSFVSEQVLKVLAGAAEERGAVFLGVQSIVVCETKVIRAKIHCQHHGSFLAKINKSRDDFGTWCPTCRIKAGMARIRERTRSRLAAYVRSRGGRLLDERLAPGQHYATILCGRHGAQRLSIAGALSKRHLWCAACKGEKLRQLHRTPFPVVERVVREKGWLLAMTESEYVNGKHIRVKCSNGHSSTRSINAIKNGHSCRSCFAKTGETAVRSAFEALFNADFPLRHPPWLRSSRGGRLELDGYNATLNLAFEYQGFTHSREKGFGEPLADVARRDAEKARICSQRGVTLVHVTEMKPDTLYDPSGVVNHVVIALSLHGIKVTVPHAVEIPQGGWLSRGLTRLRLVAPSLGLELLDETYKGVDHRYRWRCQSCNATFEGNGYYRLIGRGCPRCWRRRRSEGTWWTSRNNRPVHAAE